MTLPLPVSWVPVAERFPPEGMEVIVRGLPSLLETRAYWADSTWTESRDGPNGPLVGTVTEWRHLREGGVDDVSAAPA